MMFAILWQFIITYILLLNCLYYGIEDFSNTNILKQIYANALNQLQDDKQNIDIGNYHTVYRY